MKLLTLENSKVVSYDASYNRDDMADFLKTVINSYGIFRRLDVKTNNERKLLLYCDEYRDLNVLKTYEDNRMIHKGRRRIHKKVPLGNYLYSFIAVDYPEILYTIVNFISQKEMDFSMLLKHLKADIDVNYNNLDYYIEGGYMGYKEDAISQLKLSLNSDDLKIKYIDKVIERRLCRVNV
jgi:hypothetical protein